MTLVPLHIRDCPPWADCVPRATGAPRVQPVSLGGWAVVIEIRIRDINTSGIGRSIAEPPSTDLLADLRETVDAIVGRRNIAMTDEMRDLARRIARRSTEATSLEDWANRIADDVAEFGD